MLGHFDARSGHDESGDGGDVERVGFIAAGAASIEDRAGTGIDPDHGAPHGAGESEENVGANVPRGQQDQERGQLHGRHNAREYQAHGLLGVIAFEGSFANQVVEKRQKG